MEEMKKQIASLIKQTEEMEPNGFVVVYVDEYCKTRYAVTENPQNKIADGSAQYVSHMPSMDTLRCFRADEITNYKTSYPMIRDGHGQIFIARAELASTYKDELIAHYRDTLWAIDFMEAFKRV